MLSVIAAIGFEAPVPKARRDAPVAIPHTSCGKHCIVLSVGFRKREEQGEQPLPMSLGFLAQLGSDKLCMTLNDIVQCDPELVELLRCLHNEEDIGGCR